MVRLAVLAAALAGASCSNVITRKYEYEEDVYLDLDGSATVYVNAAVPALVALRDAPLPLDPNARLDRNDVRAWFQSPGARVASVSTSRREGRRYVHLRIETDDIRALSKAAPFAWSAYGLVEKDGVFVFTQRISAAAGKDAGNVGWKGDELVAVRLHLPSRVPFHNAPSRTIERGNIITWEQPLAARAKGEPLAIEVHLERDSILFQTLALFGGMAVLAIATLVFFIWWVGRKGKRQSPPASA
ncbi:MAG: hypothetical protein JNL48_20940 [Acidobacteria bacterium]|nr:hypothetical protein [Acidobacteriota bacterium]